MIKNVIDESGIEERIVKDRGWDKKSKKLTAKKSGKYYERTNIIAVYVNKKIIAPMGFFIAFVTQDSRKLLPLGSKTIKT